MKALYNSIKFVSAAILMVVAGACTEEAPEYVKADTPEGAQVFFKDVPASFDLTDGDGTIEITAYRGNTSSDASASLTSQADAIFSVPASVNFAAGAESAVITISYDPADIVPDTPYNFTLALADNTTPYGASSCSFSAGAIAPQLWTDFAVATFTEGFWGEEHRHTIKYRQEGNVRYCIVQAEETCDWNDPACAGGIWGLGVDFEFVWYLDQLDVNGNQLIEVPTQYMGWDYDAGQPVYLYDYYHFYKDNIQNATVMSMDFVRFAQANGENYPVGYYDGNGGFYFNLLYMVPALGAGMGFSADPYDLVAVCDGFVRTTDYNEDVEYSALYEGEMASMMFSEDGATALEFAQNVRYNADYSYDPESTTELLYTEYYLPDYFKEGHGLAFMAPIPEQLTEGAEITDVANAQNTGLVMFGNEIFVNIKKGSVSFVNGSEFPTFNIKVAVYSLDAEGNKTYDFDQFDEVYTALAYGKDNYTASDIVGLEKESFLGVFNTVSKDFYKSGAETAGMILIEDAGTDEEGTELLAIHNLSGYYGYGDTFDDVVYAQWENGYVYLVGQTLTYGFPYDGQEYPISMYVMDPDAGRIHPQIPLVAGYVQADDVIAFVAYPGYESYRGVYFENEEIGVLGAYYDIVASWPENQSTSFEAVPAALEFLPSMNEMAKMMSVSERRINDSNATPYEKPSKTNFSVEKIEVERF